MEKVTKSAVYYLNQCDLKVISDVPGNKINMIAQVSKANSAGADLFVSIHCDYSKAPKGTMPLYISDKGKKAAQLMNRYVMKYSSLTTRGIHARFDLHELNNTSMPAVVFECGSIKADNKRFKREYDAIGFGLARGVCEFLKVPFRPVQAKLLERLSGLEPEVVKHLHYNGKATNVTYKKALDGNKQVNCALYISWGLQRARVLNYHQRIWLGAKIHGSGTEALKNQCTVRHPNKRWNRCDLHIGDIVGFQWGSAKRNLVHTMVLIRFDKDRPVWATCGSSDMKAKNLSRKRKAYEVRKIRTLCRIK